MRLEVLPGSAVDGPSARWAGAVLCRDVLDGSAHPVLNKGAVLASGDAQALRDARPDELHVLWLDEGDVGEDAAAVTHRRRRRRLRDRGPDAGRVPGAVGRGAGAGPSKWTSKRSQP